MQFRQVDSQVSGISTQDGAGVTLKRIIGQPALRTLDPFLMLDEFGSDKPRDYIAGFPEHPHRGFQTVTYMLQGKMEHRDSIGNVGVIDDGGIQWMNAGRGIIHSEMPQQTEGQLRGFQLWVNLPSNLKMSAPSYEDIPAKDVPEVEQGNLTIRVLAGEFQDCVGPVVDRTVNPLFIDIRSEGAEHLCLPVESHLTAFVYCYEGSVTIGSTRVNKGHLAVLSSGNTAQLDLDSESGVILVAGNPINEPIVQYGPFVMNSEQEIRQAIDDYNRGALA